MPAVVPWDEEAETLLGRVAAMDRPLATDLRVLQGYVVGLPRRARDTWLAAGVLYPVSPRLGDGLLRFADLAHYRPTTGVDLSDPTYRDAEQNIT